MTGDGQWEAVTCFPCPRGATRWNLGQVSWLGDGSALPGGPPSRACAQWLMGRLVPLTVAGTAPVSHRLPFTRGGMKLSGRHLSIARPRSKPRRPLPPLTPRPRRRYFQGERAQRPPPLPPVRRAQRLRHGGGQVHLLVLRRHHRPRHPGPHPPRSPGQILSLPLMRGPDARRRPVAQPRLTARALAREAEAEHRKEGRRRRSTGRREGRKAFPPPPRPLRPPRPSGRSLRPVPPAGPSDLPSFPPSCDPLRSPSALPPRTLDLQPRSGSIYTDIWIRG
jgi:hypothetical protein